MIFINNNNYNSSRISENRLLLNGPLPSNSFFFRPKAISKVPIIKTKSATMFSPLPFISSYSLVLFLRSFSFVSVISSSFSGAKKPAFCPLFNQMTANFVRFVFKKSPGFVMILIIKLLSSISMLKEGTQDLRSQHLKKNSSEARIIFCISIHGLFWCVGKTFSY